MTRGQSAWFNTLSIEPSETTREVFSQCSPSVPEGRGGSNRLNKNKGNIIFEQWLVGITDGDGTFHFSEQSPKK